MLAQEDPMETVLILLPFLAILAAAWMFPSRRVRCPECGASLPVIGSPFAKTRRMWRDGGFLCARCGCETDLAGGKVAPDMPLPPLPAGRWALLGGSLLLAIGLGGTIWFVSARAVAAPPPLAVPPAVATPQP
jgi:hypothetical protein